MGIANSSTRNSELKRSNVKLQAQQVSTFNGNAIKWRTWKKKTRAAIGTAGMLEILDSSDYAEKNKMDNERVFHLLQVATSDGTASHLVDKHEIDKDGHAAFAELITWYEGDELTTETAEDVRSKLDKINLSTKNTASEYINHFQLYTRQLEDLNESYTESKTVNIFLKQISDPDYLTTKEFCIENKLKIDDCIERIRARERRLGRESDTSKRRRISVRRNDIRKDNDGDTDLESYKNDLGYYHIPDEVWKELDNDTRNQVKSYNGKRKWNCKRMYDEQRRSNESENTITQRRNRNDEVQRNVTEDSPTKKKRTVEFKDEKENESIENTTSKDENEDRVITQRRDTLTFSVNDDRNVDTDETQQISQRRFGDGDEQDSILIIDTGADQCTCGGNAWKVLHDTGEKVTCNNYIVTEKEQVPLTLPIVSAMTCIVPEDPNEEPILLIVHQACYHANPGQVESLCLPYQAEQHGVRFDLTPKHRLNGRGENGLQKMTIEEKDIPLLFDGRKMFVRIRKPTKIEIESLPSYELTAPDVFVPDTTSDHDNITSRRKNMRKPYKIYPGGYSLAEWRKRLALAPEDVVRKTFAATTQYATSVEAENRIIGRRHYKPRFSFLKENRLNDIFHSDTFFPSSNTLNGHTCSQLFLGKQTDYMKVYPMKTESHAFRALQDFSRNVGLPKGIKTDNAATEVGRQWTNYCRDHRIDTSFTEPHSPWQNYSEQGIGELGRMVKRCMREFDAPLSRHHWCQKWCADVRNHLASRKLDWRTPSEKLFGHTPDISMFRFYFWQPIEYYDPECKQPDHGWRPGRFLGIAWDHGDRLTFYIEVKSKSNRPIVLIRSTVRPLEATLLTSCEDSGEMDTSLGDLDDEISDDEENLISDFKKRRINDESKPDTKETISMATDDAETGDVWEYDKEIDDSVINEQVQNEIEGTNEDNEFHHIKGHKWVDGSLILDVELYSGKFFDIPFNIIKKDRPIETAKYIKNNVVESRRGGIHNEWAKKIIAKSNRTIRRLSRYHNIDRVMRLHRNKDISMKLRRLSRNKRNQMKKGREKFGIKVPNSVREALILDRINGNNLWAEAMAKEMTGLNNANCFEYYPGHYKFGPEYQYAPLRIIFDVKKEDLRRKARLVAGGHVINSSMFESYSSVVQTRSLRLLQVIAIKNNLKIVVADIGNAFVQAYTKEKIWSKCGGEFGDKKGCVVKIKKALYGLSTSARQWSLQLGDTLTSLGFIPSRADPDLWIKLSDDKLHYEYIATHVDDIMIASKDPMKYINILKQKYPLRNVEINPEYYLGNNIEKTNYGTIRISQEKYIKEAIRRFEQKHGTLRKENIPHAADDHPENDDSPIMNEDGITDFQQIIGVCQWIAISSRMDIAFAVSSLSRFAAKPRQGHFKRTLKTLGYLKKYPKKGYVIDPRPTIENLEYQDIVPDFGNQYEKIEEELDERLPDVKMEELPVVIFVDSNHGHDLVTGKSITGIIVFVGRTPITYVSKRQSTVQTSTFGAEFVSLKRAVEEAITIRYYLRSMGVRVQKPTIIYGDNMSAIKNSTMPSSPLKKKYLALAYHFCREHFGSGIVSIRKIDTKHNIADAFTKGLTTNEFHTHFNSFMSN